jgi:hypothetical protein
MLIAASAFTMVGCATRPCQQATAVPRGTIIAWNSSVYKDPAGWAICDAAHHKANPAIPDLSGKFLKGINIESGEANGATGGSATYTYPIVKNRNFRTGDGFQGDGPDCMAGSVSGNYLPPYYTVVYIIKL